MLPSPKLVVIDGATRGRSWRAEATGVRGGDPGVHRAIVNEHEPDA